MTTEVIYIQNGPYHETDKMAKLKRVSWVKAIGRRWGGHPHVVRPR